MKKHYIFLFTFILILFTVCIGSDETTILEGFTSKIISYKVDQLETNISMYHNENTKEYAFCIEPDEVFSRLSNKYVEEVYITENRDEIAELINAYNHLVLNENNQNKIESLYIATQLQIWNILFSNDFTIQTKSAEFYGIDQIYEYINKRIKMKNIIINDNLDCDFYGINYIRNENVDLNEFVVESAYIDIIETTKEYISFKFNSLLDETLKLKLKSKTTYDEKINNIFKVYKATNLQDVIILKDELPLKYELNEFELSYRTGDLQINKYDENNNVVYDQIEIEIFDSNMNLVKNNVNDKWFFNNGIIEIKNYLPVGTYYIKEFNNSNYLNNNTVYEINIKENEKCILNIFNTRKFIDLNIIKVDENGNNIKNTEFSLFNLNQNECELVFINTNTDIDLYKLLDITNDKKIVVSERYNKYFDGIIMNTNELGYFTYEVIKENTILNNGKVYVSNNPFLTEGNSKKIKCCLEDVLYTDNINKFSVLKNEKYLVCESEPALGYEYVDEPCQIIDTTKNFDDLTFVNKERNITLNLIKQDSIRRIPLNGAEYLIKYYDEKGYLNEEKYITGKEANDSIIQGGFLIINIPYNKPIVVKELSSPKGYQIDTNEYIIYPDVKYSKITFKNYRPNTAIVIPAYRVVKTCVE